MSLRILHITPWFPNPQNEIEAIFMAKQVTALNEYCTNQILHIKFGKKSISLITEEYHGMKLTRKSFQPLLDKWIIKEKLASKFVAKFLRSHQDEFDIINFYIAYPNAVSIGKLKAKFPKLKFTITDVWSAYYEQFNLPKGNKGRTRIENIFKHNIPLFTISHALSEDIKKFCGIDTLQYKVISNVLNPEDFYYKPKAESDHFTFCSINNWSTLKNPLVLIKAFQLLQLEDENIRLILCGSGKLSEQIVHVIKELNLEGMVIFKGRVSQDELLKTLHESQVYCQSSNYETSSAICVEALATGTPVIATNIGGMKEFITKDNGYLVNDMEVLSWKEAMVNLKKNYGRFDGRSFSAAILAERNAKRIGLTYFEYFQEVMHEK
jgi:glycosyltransferase involved in cell wall biosynthesis